MELDTEEVPVIRSSLMPVLLAATLAPPSGSAMRDFTLVIRPETGGVEAAGLVPAGTRAGHDAAGSFIAYRYVPSVEQGDLAHAVVTFDRYPSGVVTAALDYDGVPLAADHGVQLAFRLGDFERGMAIHHISPYWTAPSFVSEDRLVPDKSVLLLWRRESDPRYHLILPLAGSGMTGEVGNAADLLGVAFSAHEPVVPHHLPLFAYASGKDPYPLAQRAMSIAFRADGYYGRLRMAKPYPDVYRYFGWCSWNTYYQHVDEQDILDSAGSLQAHHLPVGFMLIDDGWLTVKDHRLAGYGADPAKFPHGLRWLVSQLHDRYRVPHVGVWHAFQGYWAGVDPSSAIGKAHALFAANAGIDGAQYLPDPRAGAGEPFYADWYRQLHRDGIDFIKVDNQGGTFRFTDGRLPRFSMGEGEQRNLQEAAERYFGGAHRGLNVCNCMALSLEDVYNWRFSNLARTSDDYLPGDRPSTKEQLFQNAYTSFWVSNFAYPDFDMFQSDDPDARYHAIARAMSGGPVYISDLPGHESVPLLDRLILADGRLLQLDAPGEVTRGDLLVDTSMAPVPLEIQGTITRPGLTAGMVAAFDAAKGVDHEEGVVRASDVEGLGAGPVALYDRDARTVTLLAGAHPTHAFGLAAYGADLFTLVSIDHGAAVLGLLDKFLGPAAVSGVRHDANGLTIRVRQAGRLGVYLERPPVSVAVDDHPLPASGFTYAAHLLTVPAAAFGPGSGEHEVVIR